MSWFPKLSVWLKKAIIIITVVIFIVACDYINAMLCNVCDCLSSKITRKNLVISNILAIKLLQVHNDKTKGENCYRKCD